ncbi:hypothetical protein [Clostridium sp.]|uniref:hypothetical protein n=1 Tax=Clostridium sp. TaxID=1506 RepID=UPI001A539059|nr:hypothetical protein [Clostridium sp.]MBK5236416.1 hypothetical protein [Clostridium sp.]
MIPNVTELYKKRKYFDNGDDLYIEKLDGMTELLHQLVANTQPKRLILTNTDDNKITSQNEIILKKLEKLMGRLELCYEDILETLEVFSLIKSNIRILKQSINKNTEKYYYRSCTIIHDSILHIKCEKLLKSQISALVTVVSKLYKEDLDKTEFYEIDSILLENNLDWIPDLDFDEED